MNQADLLPDADVAAGAPGVTVRSLASQALPANAPERWQVYLKRRLPERAVLESPTAIALEVGNLGKRAAPAVVVQVRLPEGLCHPQGDTIDVPLGELLPGETFLVSVSVLPARAGMLVLESGVQVAGGSPRLRAGTIVVEAADGLATPEGGLEHWLADIDSDLEEASQEIPAAAPAAASTRVVVFTLAGTNYAVPVDNVLEMGRPLVIRSVPNVPDWLLGVANVRGDIVSMISLRGFLGMAPEAGDHNPRVLVVRTTSHDLVAGLLVDQVLGIRTLADGGTAAAAPRVDERVAAYLRGVLEHEGRILVLLDLDRLLLSPTFHQFETT